MKRAESRLLVSMVLAAAALAPSAQGAALDVANCELVDLTHSFNDKTLFWPTSPTTFHLEQLAHGMTPGGWFYAANSFSMPEHGGTHMDAPIHFSEKGQTADQVPLERLVAPAVVIDVADAAQANADYRLSEADVARFEKQHGRIARGAIVLLHTGWDRRWPDRKAYFGDDTPNDASKLHFPSFGVEAARLLIDARGAVAIGLDTPSIDYGATKDFPVHRFAFERNVPGFENLSGLDRVPATGALVIALPMKIEGGSGGPLRAIALVPRAKKVTP
jgi:kynurenine formamidase